MCVCEWCGWGGTGILACLIGQFGLILWHKTSDGAHFFFVRATKKIKTVLDQKIPQKNYRKCKSWINVLEHLKKQFFLKIILKKLKIYVKNKKIPTFTAFILQYSLCVFQNSFYFLCSPPKKKCVPLEVFFSLLGGVNSHRPGTIKTKI